MVVSVAVRKAVLIWIRAILSRSVRVSMGMLAFGERDMSISRRGFFG